MSPCFYLFCISYALIVFSISIATVIGPTPPGDGVMNDATFSKDMLEVLAEMKGKTFKSYECVKMETSMTYGKCRLNLGTFSIDLYNYIHPMPFFGKTEDIPYFSCERMEKDSEYVTCEKSTPHVYMIDEKIQSVEIVNDEINVNDGEYEITIDQALIIRTRDNVFLYCSYFLIIGNRP